MWRWPRRSLTFTISTLASTLFGARCRVLKNGLRLVSAVDAALDPRERFGQTVTAWAGQAQLCPEDRAESFLQMLVEPISGILPVNPSGEHLPAASAYAPWVNNFIEECAFD